MNRNKKILIDLALIFICVSIYIMRPQPFDDNIFMNKNLSITYIQHTVNGGILDSNNKNFNFNSNSSEFQQIKKIFEKYSYHIYFDTLKGKASIHNNNQTFILSSGKKTIVITNVPNIIVGNNIYRVGYFGISKITALNDELKDILNIK